MFPSSMLLKFNCGCSDLTILLCFVSVSFDFFVVDVLMSASLPNLT